MNKYYLGLTLKSPSIIGDVKKETYFLNTQNVIPGSVIRGAVAEYLKIKKEDIKEFIKDIKFGFFKPTKAITAHSLPLPLTSLSCKIKKGFKPKSHGIMDALIPMLVYKEIKKMGGKFIVPLIFRCFEDENCGSILDKISGFYIKEKNYEIIETKRESQTKTAINRKTKTAQEGMLYSVSALSPGITFTGWIEAPEDKIKLLKEAISEIGIGGLTTRGFGEVKIEDINFNDIESIEERLQEFNEKIKGVWTSLKELLVNKGNIPSEPSGKYFTIDVISPAILRDKIGFLTLKFEESIGNDVDYVAHFASYEFISGWSTAWGLPKHTFYGAKSGSVYVYKTKELSNSLIEKLKKMEIQGIGEKTDEGYGEILICHLFHKEVKLC